MMQAAKNCPIIFLKGVIGMRSSFIPMKNMTKVAQIMYCNCAIWSDLDQKVIEKTKPANIPSPPRVGVGRW